MEELISLISHKMSTNFMLGAFLDGSYSNKLLSSISEDNIKDYNTISEKNKIDKQRKDILFALKEKNNSFWFNTKGFKSFIKDF